MEAQNFIGLRFVQMSCMSLGESGTWKFNGDAHDLAGSNIFHSRLFIPWSMSQRSGMARFSCETTIQVAVLSGNHKAVEPLIIPLNSPVYGCREGHAWPRCVANSLHRDLRERLVGKVRLYALCALLGRATDGRTYEKCKIQMVGYSTVRRQSALRAVALVTITFLPSARAITLFKRSVSCDTGAALRYLLVVNVNRQPMICLAREGMLYTTRYVY